MSSRYFEDSDHSELYSLFRPVLPQSLVERVVSKIDRKHKVMTIFFIMSMAT